MRRFVAVVSSVLISLSGLASVSPVSAAAVKTQNVCNARASTAAAKCLSRARTGTGGYPQALNAPSGMTPAQIRGAYELSTDGDPTTALAVVVAYDNPAIKHDLDIYSQQFGLPVLPSCSLTITQGCFMKVDQRGGMRYPAVDNGWALESSMDVEIAHATCPACKLILVEADTASYSNLATAVDRAATLGAKAISNSYGGGESFFQTFYDRSYSHPGVMITASAGDSGYGVSYPAASPTVIAVGGTTLRLDSSGKYQSESAWSGTGSGCSRYETKASWQKDTGCRRRTTSDVSAVADPATGASVFDSLGYGGTSGWFTLGGTSLSSPIIAGVYALAASASGSGASSLYAKANSSNTHDVTSGQNASCGTYLCKAVTGYDGPTGVGSPRGITAFQ